MGVQLNPLACKLSIMMKSVAVAALCFFAAVAAEADADADAYYAYGYGYGHHLGQHYGHALAYGHGYGHGYYGHPYAFGHYYGKRSADAEPAADADAYYGYPLVAAPHTVSTVHGGPLHGLTSVYGGLYGHYYGKRSADAEPTAAAAPEADADAYYHHGYAHYGHGLHHGYALAHHGHHGYAGYYGHPYLHHGYGYAYGR